MRKVIAVIAVVVLSLALSACGSSNTSSSSNSSDVGQTVDTEPAVQTKEVWVMTKSSELSSDYTYSNFVFDDKGNLTSEDMKEKGNKTSVVFEYNSDNILQKRTETHTYLGKTYEDIYTYDEHGNEITQHDGSRDIDFVTENEYDDQGRLMRSVSTNTTAGNTLTREYTYNDDGTVASWVETSTAGKGSTYTVTCEYDENGNRIKEHVSGDGSSWTNMYTYESMAVEIKG